MSRRAVVLILAGVIAAAVAIPAFAAPGPTAKSASVKGLSKRGLAKAKDSLRIARKATRASRRATNVADNATTAARGAQSTATTAERVAAGALKAAYEAGEKANSAERNASEAKAEAASTRARAELAGGTVSTESEEFVSLSGGPAVTVAVPASGLVQVWAQALVEGEGAVSLYEGDRQVAGQAIDCNGAKGVLFAAEPPLGEAVLAGTPAAYSVTGACATLGAPGPVLFQALPGEHSFELRYAACSCGGPAEEATFSQRRLVVAPLP